jgi:hypothetical protein
MHNRIGISQSNYIPWLGFFELVSKCDLFVFLESVQYTKNDWRNRNLIRINEEPHWLTIPVRTNNSLSLTLKDIEIVDNRWLEKHLATIKHSYRDRKAKQNLTEFLNEVYSSEIKSMKKLSEINIRILKNIFEILEINTKTYTYDLSDNYSKEERVLRICKELGGSDYITTAKGRSYLDVEEFLGSNLNVELITYQKSHDFLVEIGSNPDFRYSIIDSVAKVGIEELKDFIKNG